MYRPNRIGPFPIYKWIGVGGGDTVYFGPRGTKATVADELWGNYCYHHSSGLEPTTGNYLANTAAAKVLYLTVNNPAKNPYSCNFYNYAQLKFPGLVARTKTGDPQVYTEGFTFACAPCLPFNLKGLVEAIPSAGVLVSVFGSVLLSGPQFEGFFVAPARETPNPFEGGRTNRLSAVETYLYMIPGGQISGNYATINQTIVMHPDKTDDNLYVFGFVLSNRAPSNNTTVTIYGNLGYHVYANDLNTYDPLR